MIPIVNENDSVSYKEIESEDRLFGDNDMLSAVVAVLCRARHLVILSDIDGFYDHDPRLYPNAKLIEQIDTIDDSVYALAGGAGSRRGTGGIENQTSGCRTGNLPGNRYASSPTESTLKLYMILSKDCMPELYSRGKSDL